MIGIALFVMSGLLFLLASYLRERTVPEDGALRPDRPTALLMLEAVCAAIGAITVSVVHMMTFVS